jgi:hypothetical protein
MDAHVYFRLTAAIAVAGSTAALESLGGRVRVIDMARSGRQAVERVLHSATEALRLRDSEPARQSPDQGLREDTAGHAATDKTENADNRKLIERIYDGGGALTLDAPDDDAAYPAFHDMVETLLTITADGSVQCEAMPDRRRPGRTYLSVVVAIAARDRNLVERRGEQSEARP